MRGGLASSRHLSLISLALSKQGRSACPLKGHFPASQSKWFVHPLPSLLVFFFYGRHSILLPLIILTSAPQSSQSNVTSHLFSFIHFFLNFFELFWALVKYHRLYFILSMKRSSLVSSKGRSLRRENGKTNNEEVVVIEWEVRPGGLLVQKRGAGPVSSAGPMIKIKVSHDSYHHDVTVPSQSTFGNYVLFSPDLHLLFLV